ncbi:MAG: hypothetical protein P0Y49_21235 [Candidatus Pedobacter colombiensis]|uniref:Uncharacterized protein n=1 Tax=Candidatus Pedobacter colombiensis TaxID=3121371 RepID=A0AAJ5W8S6_9SPHI|nr:hypothetical protein [Pedobacter sp.]WEK19303.1 MAG: hypothetical protein P0Y49_21235 [Pedobacter sp.]
MKKEETFQAQLERFAFDPARDRVVTKLKDRSNDPYIVKKVNKAIETLTRVGFPAELLKMRADRLKQ